MGIPDEALEPATPTAPKRGPAAAGLAEGRVPDGRKAPRAPPAAHAMAARFASVLRRMSEAIAPDPLRARRVWPPSDMTGLFGPQFMRLVNPAGKEPCMCFFILGKCAPPCSCSHELRNSPSNEMITDILARLSTRADALRADPKA